MPKIASCKHGKHNSNHPPVVFAIKYSLLALYFFLKKIFYSGQLS